MTVKVMIGMQLNSFVDMALCQDCRLQDPSSPGLYYDTIALAYFIIQIHLGGCQMHLMPGQPGDQLSSLIILLGPAEGWAVRM